jgi:hypothetical protein
MFKINDDLSIYVTRGDAVAFNLSATIDNGETYLFKPNDIVRINIMEKKGCDEVVFQKGFKVEEETETVEINLTGDETKIGEVISKPTDYWYEIELNPFTNPKTIIGYDDESGAKIFKLFPEGEDADGITEEDIPIVDTELDLSSDRPVQNQAIAYAVTNVINEVNATVDNTLNEVNTMVDGVMEELKNVPNVDNIKRLQDSMNEHLVATDPHKIEDGLINKQVAEDVATDDKVLVVVDGEILKTNVDNIGVRELEATNTLTNTKVLVDEWQVMSGLNTSKTYYSVAYGNGRYVCVGDSGTSYYSTDGVTWTAMTGLDTSSSYQGVTYGDDRFVCVGQNGKSYCSTDGQTWTAMTGLSKTYNAVTYGNDRFVCVGAGVSHYSTDGLTWVAMSGLDTSKNYYGVTYGDGKFVCVGQGGLSSYSTDGLTWQAMSGLDTSKGYMGVTYGDGKFVCVGAKGLSYYSTDGLIWTAMSGLDTSKNYLGVVYGNGRFVCVGQVGLSYYSTDGVTWTAMTGLDTSVDYRSVTYGTEFVCVSYGDKSYHHVYETETNTETLQSTLQVAGTLLLTKLYTSQTTVTITDDAITTDSTFDIYTNKYGVNPKNVTVDTGSITLEFKAQETDVNIKVVVK